MAACSRTVYPPAVINAVQRQMKKRQVGPTSIPKSLELKDCMENANLKDVVVSYALFSRHLVEFISSLCRDRNS